MTFGFVMHAVNRYPMYMLYAWKGSTTTPGSLNIMKQILDAEAKAQFFVTEQIVITILSVSILDSCKPKVGGPSFGHYKSIMTIHWLSIADENAGNEDAGNIAGQSLFDVVMASTNIAVLNRYNRQLRVWEHPENNKASLFTRRNR